MFLRRLLEVAGISSRRPAMSPVPGTSCCAASIMTYLDHSQNNLLRVRNGRYVSLVLSDLLEPALKNISTKGYSQVKKRRRRECV